MKSLVRNHKCVVSVLLTSLIILSLQCTILPLEVIADINTAPVFTDGTTATRSVAENTAANTNIGTAITATDADTGDTLTYTLGGTDAASFSIVSTSGQLQTKAALDYETKTAYTVTITVSDGNGGSDSITVTINVTDVAEATIDPPLNERTPQVRDAIVRATKVNSVQMTEAHLASITRLDLQDEAITSLKAGDFDGLTRLTWIQLSDNELSSLPEDVFDGLTALKYLYLYNTNLSSLPAGVFDGLSSLKRLGLQSNKLSSLPAGVFDGLSSLEWLVLYDNDLTTLPAGIFSNLSSLTTLILKGNAVDPLPLTVSLEKFVDGQFKAVAPTGAPFAIVLPLTVKNGSISGRVTSITIPKGSVESGTLTISRTPGTTAAVTVDIGTLPSVPADLLPSGWRCHSGYTLVKSADLPLEVISGTNTAPVFTDGARTIRTVAENTAASVNIGTTITATDADTGDTLTYTLSGTDAASFSIVSTTGQLQTKAALDYETKTSYSVTVTVSDGNGGSDNITVTINVTDVTEGTINPPISQRTPQVRDAIVRAAGVQSAADVTEADLTGIWQLDLESKSITSLKVGDFNGLTSLRTLSLRDNQLTTLPMDIFDGLTALTTLNLEDNQLSTLPAGIFADLTELIYLSLADNRLTTLPAGIFEGPSALWDLWLDGNRFTTLPTGIFKSKSLASGFLSLRKLYLEDNTVDPLPLTISLEKIADGQFKAIAPPGAPFNIVLPISITNGSINGGATSVTISKGSVESGTLTVTRTAGTTADVTVDIGVLPQLPSDHQGYALRKSTDLPLEIISDINNAPVFTDGTTITRTVAENTAANTNIGSAVSATDLDNDTLTYTLSGTDAASFSIVSTTGQLQTKAALDYETKTSYSVTVSVSDGNGGSDSITVTINVTDVNENTVPVFTDGTTTTRTVAENTAANVNIGTAITATDADTGDTLTYTLGGTDAASFSIVSTSGQLQTKAALDYETKTAYTVTITVSDGNGGSDSITVTINVTDVAEATIDPPLNERTPQVRDAIVRATKVNSVQMTEAHLASITRLDLQDEAITSLKAGDFDGLTRLTWIQLSDNELSSLPEDVFDGLTALKYLYLYNTNLSSLPAGVFDGLSSLKRLGLQSNKLSSLPAGVFDGLSSLEWLVLYDNDLTTLPAGIFSNLSSLTTLILKGNAVDPLPLTVSLEKFVDGQFKAVAPTGAPFAIVLPLTVKNGSISGRVTSITIPKGSVESGTLTISRTPGTTAAVTVDIGTLPSVPADLLPSGWRCHSGYTLVKSADLPLEVISDINAAPVFTDGTTTTRTVAENTAANTNIGTVVAATDADGDTLTYTLGGIDATSFSIISTSGQLQTKAALDYETKTSYSVTVSVSDGNGGTDSITVTINVTDVDERTIDPPLRDRTPQVRDAIVAAVPGVNSAADVTVAHLAAITTLSLSEKSISSLKAGDFSGLTSLIFLYLDANSISDISPLENLTTLKWLNLGANSISDISALENLTSLKSLNLGANSISNVSALENLTSLEWIGLRYNSISDISALENLTSLERLDLQHNSVSNISALENLTALTSLNLNENYTISDISVLENLTSLVYLKLEQNSISDVSALEGLISLEDLDLKNNLISDYGPLRRLKAAKPNVNIDIDINNNPPVFSEGASTTRSITENTISWLNIGTPVSATDADNDTLVYLLRGTDAAAFQVGLITGQLRNRVALDYETKSSYSVTIVVSDENGGGDSIDVTINVTDVPETNSAPTFTDGTTATRTIAENTTANTNIGTVIAATDADSDTLTYTLGGTDAASFSIVSTSGQLQTKAALDYETKTSYSVTITVSDGNGGSDTITVTINVTDINETPAKTTYNTGDIITTLPDKNLWFPDTFTNATWRTPGAIIRVELQNGGWVEEGNFRYTCVAANGGTCAIFRRTVEQGKIVELSIVGKGTNTAPVFTDGTSTTRAIAENTAANTNIGTAIAATDADTDDTLTYTLSGTDAASFSIVSTSGQLQTKAALDYETKSTYTVTLTVSDGSLTDTITVTVNVTDINELPTTTAICKVGDILAPGESCTYPGTDAVFSVLADGSSQWNIPNLPTWLQWVNQTSVNNLMRVSTTVNGQAYHFVAEQLANNSWEIKEIGDDTSQQPDTSEQPGDTDGTPTPTTSTTVPLTEATLNGGIVTLSIDDQTYEASVFRIKNAVSVTGIPGVTIDSVERVSDMVIAVELAFNGNIDTDTTLTFTVDSGAIVDYTGPEFTAQTTIPAVTESVVASVEAPLTGATLDESIVTLTLSGRKFEQSNFDIRGAVSVTGITGVTVRSFDIDRQSDTEVTVELTFNGNLNADGTLTFTVGPDAIAGYNGPALTAQVAVSVGDTPADVGGQNTDPSETPEQPGDQDTPQQPGNIGGTPTLSVSTTAPLTETTLHGGIITLNLSGGTYEQSSWRLRDAVSVSGITGIALDTFDTERISDTQLTIKLEFDGNINTSSTLTITLKKGAIVDYDGAALTAQIPVSAISESVTASTATPLTEATLDESVITLTLSGRKFERWNSTIRSAVSVTGISGVTVRSFDIDRESDTEVTVELTFNGDMTSDGTLTLTVGAGAIAGYNGPALTDQVSVSASTDAPADTGNQNPDPPETPQQPGNQDTPQQQANTGGTPTLSVSTAAPLTEAMLHGGVITLTLSNGTFERSMFWIRNAVSVSGIAGVDVESFGGERVSDTQVTIEFEYEGNMTANGTLTISLEAGGIQDYDGATLTAQIPVTANTESIIASTAAPLTEATLDEGIVTLTLSGAKYASSIWDIRDAVTVSGINGVTKPWNQPKRKSDTELTVELEFDGDMTADGTLTFTVGADAIAGYNGPALTAQVSVSAGDTPADTGGQNPDPPETPQQPGGQDTPQQPIVTGGTPTLSVSTAAPLTEAMLHGGVITLTLSNGTFERSMFWIRNAVSVSGITGIDVESFGGERISDTQVTIELEYEGNLTANGTLTIALEADGITDYDGATLTAQIPVTANTESITASTAAPLTEATLDESIVTLTLSGAKYASSIWDLRGNVTVSGIAGVTIPWNQPERKSDTELTIELEFDGDMARDGTLTFTVDAEAIAGYNGPALTVQVSVSAEDTPADTGGQNPDPPEQPGDRDTPQQPGNTGGTTLSVSTAAPLTEATLHGGVITLTLSNGVFERSMFWIRVAMSVSGINGVSVESFGGERISDTQVTIELEYEGNMTANGTLTIALEADGIKDYEGATLTAQISVTANTESITASTAAPLTEATLDESIVTLTLSGAKYASSIWDLRGNVTVSGITGVTIPWNQPKRKSDTELTVELEFDGDMTRDGTLTFTVDAEAIAGYNGPALTAQVAVSAGDTPADVGGQNPDPPETPQQLGNTGGTTLSVSTAAPLTEATLHGSVVTLTLSGGKFERTWANIREAVLISGIDGVSVDYVDIVRKSDTEVTVELTFAGNLITDGTLTLAVGAAAIVDHNEAFIFQLPVTAVEESITASTETPLTEATLHGSVVTLTLNGRKFERTWQKIRDAVSVSGIAGVTVDQYDIDRQSDTEVTVELTFDGDFDADTTLTLNIGPNAIAVYDGPPLTAQISVPGGHESITASTKAPLTEATLDGSTVTLTLSGRIYASSGSKIRSAVSVSGIPGVTIRPPEEDCLLFWVFLCDTTYYVRRVSDTEVTVTLEFEGDIDRDGTLTFTVGADAIAGYNGPNLTAQVPVTAIREQNGLLANFPNPFNPETWIPYQLAKPAEVTITIYAVNGQVVRRLALGHQAAGLYQNRSRAAYWDGRNTVGEPVASGVYFYTLTAGGFTATRKMLIRK